MALLVPEGFDDWNAARSAALQGKTYPSGASIVQCSVATTNTGTRYSTGRRTNFTNFEEIQWSLPAALTEGYCAFQFILEQNIAGSNIAVAFKDGGSYQCELKVDGPSGFIFCTRNGTQVGATSSNNVCPLGAWVWISIYVKIDNSVGRMQVYVDGVLRLDITGDLQNTANANYNRVVIDQGTNPRAQRDDFFIMDLTGASFNGHIPETRIVPMPVTGDGVASVWAASAGADWECVDEIPPNDDTDYISSSTPGDISLFTTGSVPSGLGTILALYGSYRGRKDDAASRSIRNVLRSGGTNYNSATDLQTSIYGNHQGTLYELDPATGLAWTSGNAASAQVGVEEIA